MSYVGSKLRFYLNVRCKHIGNQQNYGSLRPAYPGFSYEYVFYREVGGDMFLRNLGQATHYTI